VKRNSETTSKAQVTWAKALLINGTRPVEVAALTGVNVNYVRVIKKRILDSENGVFGDVAPVAHAAPVAVSPTETPATETRKTAETARFKVPILETVFWTTTATACAGFFQAFQVWGLPVATVYTLILLDAMSMAKDIRLQKSAEQGAAAVIVLEMLAACAHTYVFNGLLWANYKSLPFTVKQSVVNGEIVWINGDKPFLIACVVACFLSGSAIYAVDLTIKKTRERAKQ